MKKVAILTGGTGPEVEVAKKSAAFISSGLKIAHDIYLLPQELDRFMQNISQYDFAIPIFHGEYGEDGKIFAFLDLLGIPHTFSSYDVHAISLDKFRSNIFAEGIGLNVSKQYLYKGKYENIGFPCIVKPNHGGSSFFTYKVSNEDELFEACAHIKANTTDDILVQEFILGEEVSVPIVDGEVLPIMSLEKKNYGEIFDYNSKYVDDSLIQEVFGKIEGDLKNSLTEHSLKLYNYLGCKGFVRIDYIVRGGVPYYLEINTIPGMTEASIVPKAWKLLGRTKESLIEAIIKK